MSSQIYNFFPRNGLIYGEISKFIYFIVPKKTNITTLMLLQKKETIQPTG
jgi:hypothetical protein